MIVQNKDPLATVIINYWSNSTAATYVWSTGKVRNQISRIQNILNGLAKVLTQLEKSLSIK
jgi:hypothetical protein